MKDFKSIFTKKNFLYFFYGSLAVLFLIKIIFPTITKDKVAKKNAQTFTQEAVPDSIDIYRQKAESTLSLPYAISKYEFTADGKLKRHKIYSVPDFNRCFPDSNNLHIATAMRLGVKPVQDRRMAEKNKTELVYVGNSPYYHVKKLYNSIPYLVPSAALLLEHIARTFHDSLYIKGIPLNTLMITSLLRTEDDVAALRRHNGNASDNSAHRYGTTFDIAYNKYVMVQDPALPKVRPVRDDTLKYVLSEVLKQAREQGLCYVKYERHQGCYHITVR